VITLKHFLTECFDVITSKGGEMKIATLLNRGLKTGTLSMVFPLFLMAEVHASAEDVHKIIDICSSSERMMKDYALIGMKVTYHNPQKDIEETIKRLDREIEELKAHKLSESLYKEEEALQTEWLKIEDNLTHDPSKESALTLYSYINTFAAHCEVLAEHLAKNTGNPAEHYVVLIARLNLDVQELAAVYTMKAWGAIEDKEYYPEVSRIIEDYHKTYSELIGAESKMVSENVKSKLRTLKKHFMVFEHMSQSKSGRFVPLLMAKKAEKINHKTEEILKLEETEVEK
jgi:hypothetical protein